MDNDSLNEKDFPIVEETYSSEDDHTLEKSNGIVENVVSIQDQEIVYHHSMAHFGSLEKIQLIQVVEKEHRVARIPILRQYFIDGVLHREEGEHKTSWTELFVDLIYVGCIAKAGHLIREDYSWHSVFQFILIFDKVKVV